MYRDEYHPRVRKDLKKLDRRTVEEVRRTHIPKVLNDPALGGELVGDLAGIRSYHFRAARTEYRIAYVVSEEEQAIYVLMIGKREGFYDLLKRKL